MINKQIHTCRNCGNLGHLYKNCPHPITSFGIICYREPAAPAATQTQDVDTGADAAAIEYLMIQRKDSLCFMEFIRGKYELKNFTYIRNLLSGMTISERNLLLTQSFDELWNHVWYQTCMIRQTNEYTHAKAKFDSLYKGYSTHPANDHKKITLKFLLESSVSPFEAPEWGFPKGRRKIHEDDVKCAIREFTEETGIGLADIIMQDDMPAHEEIFYGTNNILYRHVYYIARMRHNDGNAIIVVDPENTNQAREVRAIKWLKFEDVMSHIRDHNQERKELFYNVHKKLSAAPAPVSLSESI